MLKHVKELSGLVAAIGLLAGGAHAQSSGAAAGAQPSRVMITRKDSAGRVLIYQGSSPLIDSLIKRLNNLPVGSADFIATNQALDAAMRELPRPVGAGTLYGEFRVDVAAPRAALNFSAADVVPQGTLGFTADAVNRRWYSPVGQYVQYFEYPTIVAIEANSPASRAGVRVGDSVLAYNSLDLRGQAFNFTQLLTPGRDVSVRLRRDGESRDVVVAVDKAPERLMAERRAEAVQSMAMDARSAQERRMFEERAVATRMPGSAPTAVQGVAVPRAQGRAGGGGVAPARTIAPAYAPQMRGLLGAAMTDVEPGLAAVIRGMEGKRGVLVTGVPEGSFAFRTGLRPGDVILRAEAADVASVAQLSVRLYLADQTSEKVRLTVLRAGKTLELTYTPR